MPLSGADNRGKRKGAFLECLEICPILSFLSSYSLFNANCVPIWGNLVLLFGQEGLNMDKFRMQAAEWVVAKLGRRNSSFCRKMSGSELTAR